MRIPTLKRRNDGKETPVLKSTTQSNSSPPQQTATKRPKTAGQQYPSLSLRLLAPLILLPHLRLLLRTKIIRDIKRLPNLLRRFPLDHARHGRARQIQQRFDIHVIRREDEFEEEDLLDVDEVGVPLLDDLGHLCGF
eukprot:CAMPEP_0201657218 /NCGR_PEP_ID=MMETSP0494-20130426/526_1 /ASSEMBLY_ACC=CAM_ASM_000839 /TAXON_ID=420259 /ORGANISM="Thalassiosira gravida, Strain GMp14c1" /LENGTH=136 /DNA_ID=CAMNT_0048134011 /DNA_START=329 /DNA_END=739 /DNA_ORIENTATION=+